jgi:predicted patatin/cPLA2 family phospholipase
MSTEEFPVFKIGLVLAGAVSAGAYTAGVVDFLFEALEAWEQ